MSTDWIVIAERPARRLIPRPTLRRIPRLTLRLAMRLLFTVSCLSGSDALSQLALEPVVGGLASPVAITHAGDGTGRLFVTEQGGRIRIVAGGALLSTPFLDISTSIASGGERGLLSVAFHPDYSSNGRFFVFYTDKAGSLVIAEHSVSADPNVAAPGGTPLLTIPHPGAANHNGGQLLFGPDGYLYAGTGDGGGGGDPFGNGQNLGTLLGKILRLDVDGGSLVPPDNPFVDGDPATRDEIWAYGLRNPWRFSFDRTTGDLFIGDVGQGCWEEIDLEPAGSPGGRNYGWPVMEGSKCYDPSSCNPPPICIDPSFTLPIVTYGHTDPSDCAVTGGHVYRGSAVPSLAGQYLYADYCSGRVWGAARNGGAWNSSILIDTTFLLTTFGEDETGEILMADAISGMIYRIASAAAVGFEDDFEDGDASDWLAGKGTWDVSGGRLVSDAAKKAEIIAPYGGCSLCTVSAGMRTETPGASVSLLAWYGDASNHVELKLDEKKDRVTLKHLYKGKKAAKSSTTLFFDAGEDVDVSIAYDGTVFRVYVNGSLTPLMTVTTKKPADGGVGFRVKRSGKKKASGSFEGISVM